MDEYQEITKKIKHLYNMDKYLETEEMLLAENSIDMRLRQKKYFKEKVNVVFVCHRPQIWLALKTVYEALASDILFDVKIVTIPVRKALPDKGFINDFESEGAELYWNVENCINGYDVDSGKWLDLRTLNPDYIFFQQPYNIMRPESIKSWYVSKYAKICYVAYGYEMMRGSVIEGSHPEDFFQNVSFYFAQDEFNQKYMLDYFERKNNVFSKTFLTGYPKFDGIKTIQEKKNNDNLNVLWCPRWAEDEGNCHFYDYGKKLAEYVSNKENLVLSFRPHPQMLVNIKANDSRNEVRLAEIVNSIDSSDHCEIDERENYLESFEESDCLLADMTSLMGDYFLTGKPIIYCHRVDCFSDAGRELSEGFYWVNNWEELEETIDMLAKGEDPLFEKRLEIIKKHYYLPQGGAGKTIADIIRKDATK